MSVSSAVPLWKVIAGPRAGKLNRTRKGPVSFFTLGKPERAMTPGWRLRDGSSLLKLPWSYGSKGSQMAWTTPILVEICIGLEINGYLPAEF